MLESLMGLDTLSAQPSLGGNVAKAKTSNPIGSPIHSPVSGGAALDPNSPQKPEKKRRKKSGEGESGDGGEQDSVLKKDLKRAGIWEVTMNNGVVLGLFDGTPQRIGAWIVANQQITTKTLIFQRIKIREVPDEIVRDSCCDRKFQRIDNFCPRCGGPRRVEPSIPESVTVEVYSDAG